MSILKQVLSMGAALGSPTEPIRVLGIDLGTTNSTIAEIVYDPSQPKDVSVRCLAVEQPTGNRGWWNPLVPSVVALHEGKEIVGEGARRLRARWREAGLIDKGNFFAGCKNDMGLRRTYHMAPGGYRSAAEIGGRLLDFLRKAALKDKPLVPSRTTVTVPASFQAAQRQDTLKAASLGGLDIQRGDLLDEPVAAFLGYLSLHPDQELLKPGENKTLLVFDFGGGTCDVAILRLGRDADSGRLTVATLAVSRYHRLGGGDIDQAIARLSDLMRRRNAPDSGIINQVAMYCGYMKDFEREEELYREAIKVNPEGSTPWFNLALLLRQQKRLDEAKEAIDQAIRLEANTGPYYVLQAKIVKEMEKDFAAEEFLAIGLKRFPPLPEQSDWELHWFQAAAEMREDKETMEAVRRERHSRQSDSKGEYEVDEGILPDLAVEQLQLGGLLLWSAILADQGETGHLGAAHLEGRYPRPA